MAVVLRQTTIVEGSFDNIAQADKMVPKTITFV